MSYIGSTPTTQSFIAGTDYFNGTGSQVAFTLSRSVNSVNDIEVIVNNVEQIPSGYSVSGTTLTFSAAPSAGTSNVYVRYLSTTNLSLAIPAGTSATFNTVTATSLTATNLTVTNGASIQGLTVGRGAGAVATNTAVGASAVASNTSGTFNTATGYEALRFNTTGGSNTANGLQALYNNTTASNNTAVGFQAGYTATTNSYNVFLGYQAGYTSNYNGNGFNTCVGVQTGYSLTTGVGNTFIGGASTSSGYYVTTGSNNTILGGYTGNQGGLDIRTASNYIVLSDGAGYPRLFSQNGALYMKRDGSTTDGNVIISQGSDGNAFGALSLGSSYGPAGSGDIALILQTNAGKRVWVQNRSGGVYLQDGGTSWTSNSDERLKENLVPIQDALIKVASLRSVTGNYIADETKKSMSFLVAQDVQAVLPEAVDATDPDKLGVQYSDVIPLLVAAIKELKAEIDILKGQP